MHQTNIAVETKCNAIKLAFLNIRSLKNKSFLINDLITTNNLDFMFLNETWLEDSCSATVLNETAPPNFTFMSVCRTVRRGGGVAALFKDVYQCKQVSFGQYLSFEYLGIVLKGAPRILFIIIYRPPKYSPAFVEEFTEMLSMISSEFDCFAIAGDFNIHIDNAENKTTKEIITVLNTFDLIQHVHEPTHNRGHTLDLLISRGLNISSIVIKDVALSDHFCIFFDILISVTTESRSVSVRKRCINENTSVLFMEAISLTPSISADSVDLLLDSFNSKVKNVIDDIAPLKVSRKTGRQKSAWRKSTAVQSMKRQCRKAERMWRKTKLEIHYSIYKDSLRTFNVELGKARQSFFSNLINSNLNNTRTLFATVERLTNPPNQIASEMLSDSKCNEFASFFSEKINNIRKAISTSPSYAEVRHIRPQYQKEDTMSAFEEIDSKILEEIVQHLKSSTCYLDTLPTYFFKRVLNCLEADLLEVVNASLLSGTFPNSLKTAVVKPLLKKRNLDNTILSNYRPISNLPFIGKIIEKVVFNQLNKYLNSNGYLDNFQSGFRPHHSTETALIKIINDIRLNSESGKISVLVLLDLSAAFDTVDHNILLERLENLVGLSGMVIKWFRSYLEGRGYYVSIGEHKSKWTSMTCGVPQGSILAPLLFSLYMLPLSQIMRKNQIAYHSYADDTQIYLALSPNDYSPIDSLCQCIDEINSWMCENFLQLNKEKTEVIAFGNKDEVLKVNAYLDSRGLTTKNQVRNLGVILETDLSFSSHVKAVTKSAYYHLKNIARIRGFVSSQDLEKLVHAFIITSRVDYCNGLLTGLPKKTIRQLQLIQNAAARILTRTRKSEHITPVLRSLHWL
uniref:Reverse transcriptase domain-containing protein n=1 Tax=Sinocyclocheilus grahami TaxID=75366 RepID=A0A672SSK0_SINGR